MTESAQISEFRVCLLSAFETVTLDNVSLVSWMPDTVLADFQLNHQTWTNLPLTYFEELGSDSIWLSEGRKLLYLLPSAMMHTIDKWSPRKPAPDIGATLVARLLNMADPAVGDPDFKSRRLFTIFQSHTVWQYLHFVAANDDDSYADDASRAIDLFWGRFEDC